MADTGLQTPTLQATIERIREDIETRLPGEGARLRRSFLYVLASVLGGAVYSAYGFTRQIARNVIVDRIEDSEILERLAGVWDVVRDPGTAASGSFVFAGTPAAVVPAGSSFSRADGTKFRTDAEGILDGGGEATIAATATAPGEAGNIGDTAEELSLDSAISGVSSTITPSAVISNGSNPETDESLRTRFLETIRTPPQGGAGVDYVAWAKAAPGVSADVSRVWIDSSGAASYGEVRVYFALAGSGAEVIPLEGDLLAVLAYITEEDASGHRLRAPVTASVIVPEVTGRAIHFTIGLTPNTTETQAAVRAELEAMFSAYARVATASNAGIVRNALIHSALVRTLSSGVSYYTLTSVDGGAGWDDIVPSDVGELPYLGTTSFVTL